MTASLNATEQGMLLSRCDVAPESASQADSQPACLTGVCLLVRSSPEERSVVAPQNNNLAAAFPLAPRSLHQNLRWSKETTRESYLVRGACGRAQGHAPLATHGKSGILRQLHFFARGGGRGAAFYRAGRYFAHAPRCRWPYGAKEVTKRDGAIKRLAGGNRLRQRGRCPPLPRCGKEETRRRRSRERGRSRGRTRTDDV